MIQEALPLKCPGDQAKTRLAPLLLLPLPFLFRGHPSPGKLDHTAIPCLDQSSRQMRVGDCSFLIHREHPHPDLVLHGRKRMASPS